MAIIQAETLNLTGDYKVENNLQNGETHIFIKKNQTNEGDATLNFNEGDGTYDLTIGYLDGVNDDGTLEIFVAGTLVETINLNVNDNASNTLTIPNLDINDGDEVKISGTRVGDDGARVDVLEFTAAANADDVAPTAIPLTPADDSADVPVDTNLSIQFDEDIQAGTGNIVITSEDGTLVETLDVTDGEVTIDGDTLTINPIVDLQAATNYYVKIDATAVEDLAGNAFVGIADNTTWNFTTAAAPDLVAPTATILTPADESATAAVDANLSIVFDEDIQAGTGNVVVKKAGGTVVETLDVTGAGVTIAGNTLTINPTPNLEAATGYYVEIDATAVTDGAGNAFAGIADATTWNFTTAAAGGGDAGGGDTGGGDTGGGDTGGGDAGGGDTDGGAGNDNVDDTSGGDTSGGDTSGGDTSGGDTSGGDTSGGDTSGGDTSGGDTSGGDTSGGDTSGGDTSGDTGTDLDFGSFPEAGQTFDDQTGGATDDILNGNENANTVTGDAGNDVMLGFGGDDNLSGGEGDDVMAGNDGADNMNGGTGSDVMLGGEGGDAMQGGDGDDVMAGEVGNDRIDGNSGADLMFGNIGDDSMDGGAGNDTMFGGKDDDLMKAGLGEDVVVGDLGNDFLTGEGGNDVLFGNVGNDFLEGGDGSDTLFGGQNNDILTGGSGIDVLSGDLGDDTLTGGSGADRFDFAINDGIDVVTDFTDVFDVIGLKGGLTFEDLAIVQAGADTQITAGTTLSITLQGINASDIGAADFAMV